MKIITIRQTKTEPNKKSFYAQVYNTSGKVLEGYGRDEITALKNLMKTLEEENPKWILTNK